MFASQLTSQIIPVLHLQDSIERALQLMQENHVTQLPVVNKEKFLGMIDEDALLDARNETVNIASLHSDFSKVAVNESSHLFNVLKLAEETAGSIIAVIKENGDFAGTIPLANIVRGMADMIGVKEPGAVIVIEMDANKFSAGEINRLVETNDAVIMQMNTSIDKYTGKLFLSLKLNKPDVSDIVATFQRYDYNVTYYQGEEEYENELRTNYDNLINYLSI